MADPKLTMEQELTPEEIDKLRTELINPPYFTLEGPKLLAVEALDSRLPPEMRILPSNHTPSEPVVIGEWMGESGQEMENLWVSADGPPREFIEGAIKFEINCGVAPERIQVIRICQRKVIIGMVVTDAVSIEQLNRSTVNGRELVLEDIKFTFPKEGERPLRVIIDVARGETYHLFHTCDSEGKPLRS